MIASPLLLAIALGRKRAWRQLVPDARRTSKAGVSNATGGVSLLL
jgi:hypothetical protein